LDLKSRQKQLCKIQDIAEFDPENIGKDFSFSTINYLDTSSVIEGKLDEIQTLSLDDAPSRAKRLVKENDIIISTVRPNLRHYYLVKNPQENLVVSTGFVVIRPTGVNPHYLYYFLTAPLFIEYLSGIAASHTSTYPSFPPDVIKNAEIDLPSLPEQQKIGKILYDLDSKIENLQNQNKILDQIAQAIFKSWFIDFDGITEFEDSELGMIPKGWSILKFSDVAEILSGGTPSTKQEEYWNGNVKWVTIDDLKRGIFIIDTEKKITKLGLEKSSAKILPKYTIVISARGTVGLFSILSESMSINQSCYGLKGRGIINEIYLFFLLKFSLVNFLQHVHGSVFDTITQKTFEEINVISPPNKKIEEFQNYMHSIFEIILKNQLQIQLLTKIRDSLLPKLMSGEIRV